MNILRVIIFLFGLFILVVGLLNLFLIPINTDLSCNGTQRFCTANKQYFFYSRNHISFSSQDISEKEIVTHGGKYDRSWSLRLNTPAASLVVGEYKSKEAAQKALEDINKFQKNPTGKLIDINAKTHIEHIFGTVVSLLTALGFLWVSVKPPKNLRW